MVIALRESMHVDAVEICSEWIKKLQDVLVHLRKLDSSSEVDFLDIGEELGSFYMDTEEISNLSFSVVSHMTGDEVVNTISSISGIFGNLDKFAESCLKENDICIKCLLSMQKTVKRLGRPLDDIRKIVQMLMILGISTRIESARLGQDDMGFNILAREIRELSSHINLKVYNIYEQMEAIYQFIEDTIDEASGMKYTYTEHLKKTLEDLGSSLNALKRIHDHSLVNAKINAEKSRKIADHLGEVVSSLQFHDITRQQIEHVIFAIEGIISDLRYQQGLIKSNQQPDFIDIDLATRIWRLLNIQKAQLQNSQEHLKDATDSIKENLKSISLDVEETSRLMRSSTGESDEKSVSLISNVEQGINSAASSFRQGDESQEKINDNIVEAVDKTSEISGAITSIEETGTYIELIALNARVKAAHTGSSGSALSIIAESIQRVSIDSCYQTEKLTKILENVLNSGAILKENLDSYRSEESNQADKILGDLRGILEVLQNLKSTVDPIVDKIEKMQLSLTGRIIKTVDSIKIEEKTSDALSVVFEILENVLNQIRELAPTLNTRTSTEELEKLIRRYTMESERQVHLSALSPQLPTEIKVETFNTGGDSDLGDNVELF
jgi:methyl-accepting chemotaxis protein